MMTFFQALYRRAKLRWTVSGIVFVLLAVAPALNTPAFAIEQTPRETVIYLFWGQGCPHCEHEKKFLAELKQRHPEIVVMSVETWHNPANKELYKKMSDKYGLDAKGSVPGTFINTSAWLGFNDKFAAEIEAQVKACAAQPCEDPARIVSGKASEDLQTQVPLLGTIDAGQMSLPLLAIILGGIDGFNPCAFFVLLTLLSLMVHAGSRARMLIVGGVFVFFSGLVYFLFMAAWLNLFVITGRVVWITALAGMVAVVIGLLNVKYYFLPSGVSLTIADKDKADLFTRMRGLLRAGSVMGLLAGTIVLALLANLYELLCTAGFPMVFTRALTLHQLPMVQYYGYLLLYNVVYIIPLAVIVVVFAVTLGSRKLTEAEGGILKLISGLMMLGLGSVLVVRPDLLNNLAFSFGLIVAVVVLAFVLIALRKFLGKKS